MIDTLALPALREAFAIDPTQHRFLFRDVNERILGASSSFGPVDSLRIVCECRSLECTERVDVPTAVFEAVRPAGDRFVVLPGHETSADRVIAAEGAYAVVIEQNLTPVLEAADGPPAA